MKIQTIKTTLYVTCLAMLLMLGATYQVAQAAEGAKADAKKVNQISMSNPVDNYGIKVGDQLTRQITFIAQTPYKLTKKSLPKKNSQFEGIELIDVMIKDEAQDSSTQYQVTLIYQVFINPGVPSNMQLPAFDIALTGAEEAPTVAVPNWKFWFAPLAVGNNDNAANTMQADIKPPLLDADSHKNRFIALLTLAAVSALALLYMNADGRWLPFMGGAFAQAHRQLKKLSKKAQPKTQKEEKQALVYIHQAFNSHYGANIFARDIEHFITLRPSFAKMKAEITAFFDYSNKSLYATKPRDSAKIIQDLVQLSKALRDCERGV